MLCSSCISLISTNWQSCQCLSSFVQQEHFSWIPHFCAHSLVAQPHLSIRVCVSMCRSLLLVYLFHLRICESLSTLLTLTNNCLNFVPLVLTKPLHKLYFVGVSEQVWYQFHYSFISHYVKRDTSSTLGNVSWYCLSHLLLTFARVL